MFEKLCIVGVGLIGGSLGLAARERGLARHVVGAARREATIREAIDKGAIDAGTTNLPDAARDADLIFLATPVGAMRATCELLAPVVKAGAIITDGGSTKADVVAECAPLFDRTHFIGGHPMAGSEQTGVEAARADLFEGATWVLTPTVETPTAALETLTQFVEDVGARCLKLDAAAHDRLVAVTSHLPHITAAALTHGFAHARRENATAAQLVGSGWRDATRVAAGSPEMWRDICLHNREALLQSTDDLIAELQGLRTILERGDGAAMLEWFEAASRERREVRFQP